MAGRDGQAGLPALAGDDDVRAAAIQVGFPDRPGGTVGPVQVAAVHRYPLRAHLAGEDGVRAGAVEVGRPDLVGADPVDLPGGAAEAPSAGEGVSGGSGVLRATLAGCRQAGGDGAGPGGREPHRDRAPLARCQAVAGVAGDGERGRAGQRHRQPAGGLTAGIGQRERLRGRPASGDLPVVVGGGAERPVPAAPAWPPPPPQPTRAPSPRHRPLPRHGRTRCPSQTLRPGPPRETPDNPPRQREC